MKQNHTHRSACSIGVALLLTLSLTQCSLSKKNCCGYSGPVVSPRAISLYAIDHFIPKDTIDKWTARYENYLSLKDSDSLRVAAAVLPKSCSFNGYYVQKILCNERSIGMRLLTGMDHEYKLHIIVAGINPDYSTLYIRKPETRFALPKTKNAIMGVNSINEEQPLPFENVLGGLQFSQKP